RQLWKRGAARRSRDGRCRRDRFHPDKHIGGRLAPQKPRPASNYQNFQGAGDTMIAGGTSASRIARTRSGTRWPVLAETERSAAKQGGPRSLRKPIAMLRGPTGTS